MAVKEMVMDSWEEEMAATAERAKARSKNIVKKTKATSPDRRYPATWSRFPSHTRGDRSNVVGVSHKVDVKDFAVLGHENGEIIWCLEHDDQGHHAVIEDPNAGKGFTARVKDRVKNKAYKLDTAQRQAAHTSGRRGSLSMANQLEYPELEILPVDLMTAAELEAHLEEERLFEERAAQRKAASAGPSVNVGLVDGISEFDSGSASVEGPSRQ